MADISIDFFSNSLMRSVTFKMFIPNDFRADIPREETEYSKRKMKTLFLLHGYTDKEIAKRVGISETAVSSRATRGRTLLREIVEKEGFCV